MRLATVDGLAKAAPFLPLAKSTSTTMLFKTTGRRPLRKSFSATEMISIPEDLKVSCVDKHSLVEADELGGDEGTKSIPQQFKHPVAVHFFAVGKDERLVPSSVPLHALLGVVGIHMSR